MYLIALKILFGDRAKYMGIVFGIALASFVITQQLSIFVGLMSRTYGFLTDTPLPDIWVMDTKVQFIDDIKPLQDTQLLRVRGIKGVEWATPLYKGLLKARLSNGNFQNCNVIGLDDQTLIGGPPRMLEGSIADLRRADGIIIDSIGAAGKLAKPATTPGGKKEPLTIGDTVELNDHRAVVVGIAEVSRTFQSQPVIYTTYSRATTFAPKERKLLSFILVKASKGQSLRDLADKISRTTGLKALTRTEFQNLTVDYFLRYTGIPINFGIAVLLGFLVGTAIAGQTFYNFTIDNLKYFGALKAMGASNGVLLKMIVLQALVVGIIGYGMGVGVASLFYFVSLRSELAFKLPWQLLAISGFAVTFICIFAAIMSIRRIVDLEPAIVFRG